MTSIGGGAVQQDAVGYGQREIHILPIHLVPEEFVFSLPEAHDADEKRRPSAATTSINTLAGKGSSADGDML